MTWDLFMKHITMFKYINNGQFLMECWKYKLFKNSIILEALSLKSNHKLLCNILLKNVGLKVQVLNRYKV